MLSLKRMDNFCGKQFQKFIFEFIIKNTIFRTYLRSIYYESQLRRRFSVKQFIHSTE